MKFRDIKPGALFTFNNTGKEFFFKMPDPLRFLYGCDKCGFPPNSIWNTRAVDGDHLVHTCPDTEVIPCFRQKAKDREEGISEVIK